MKKTSLTSFVRKFLFAYSSINRHIICFWKLYSYKGAFPLYGHDDIRPNPPPPRHTQEKKKEKRKEERVLVGALNFRTLCTSMMSKLTPCVLIIISVKMTHNYQRLYTKMNFRLSPYIFSGKQLQRYWILSRPL